MELVIRRHLSFANVTSLAALVFAMGGTGYALTIPSNSVGTKQIKKNGVAASEIRKSAVSSTKVKNGSLLAADFKAGQIPAGAPGAPGATGAKGAQGPPGVVGAITVQREALTVDTDPSSTTAVTCPAGSKVIGGGARVNTNAAVSDIPLTVSEPTRINGPMPGDGDTFDAWRIDFANPAGGTVSLEATAYAICVQT